MSVLEPRLMGPGAVMGLACATVALMAMAFRNLSKPTERCLRRCSDIPGFLYAMCGHANTASASKD